MATNSGFLSDSPLGESRKLQGLIGNFKFLLLAPIAAQSIYKLISKSRELWTAGADGNKIMATNPGFLSDWPWKKLGNFKYLLLAPIAAQSIYELISKPRDEIDTVNLLIIPLQLLRAAHSLIWISWARFQTASNKHTIVHKSLNFEQVDRERNWDDQLILTGIVLYVGNFLISGASKLSIWDTRGAILIALSHAGPVEFLYYWFHRLLHHHYLYTRYHSHHHASIVTEPITSVIHPFAEEAVYFLLFLIPLATAVYAGHASIVAIACYILYIDFMNYMGHCNFEIVPLSLFKVFPPLKYLMYTPTFHSLHHTQFRTNYSLFMPMYDYLYATADKASDEMHERTARGKEETPDVVHLSHPTSLKSIYQLRLGFASMASNPYSSSWYDLLVGPLSLWSMLLLQTCRSAIVVEKNKLKAFSLQTWIIPRFSFQYKLSWEKDAINAMIEKSILDADARGVKVISLGLLNHGEELNKSGGLFIQKHPNLKLRIVDGSSMTAAAVIHSIPEGTEEVLLIGNLSKVAFMVAAVLCRKSITMVTVKRNEFGKLKLCLPSSIGEKLVLRKSFHGTVWLAGDGLKEEEQRTAVKGTIFIPLSQFPLKESRKDCYYFLPPAMIVPKNMENMHSCENWLPRRMMSTSRVAGIIHGLDGREEHETGDAAHDIEDAWEAALKHGFLPSPSPLLLHK